MPPGFWHKHERGAEKQRDTDVHSYRWESPPAGVRRGRALEWCGEPVDPGLRLSSSNMVSKDQREFQKALSQPA